MVEGQARFDEGGVDEEGEEGAYVREREEAVEDGFGFGAG